MFIIIHKMRSFTVVTYLTFFIVCLLMITEGYKISVDYYKPGIEGQRKPISSTTHKPPEERRKSQPMLPKTIIKFTVNNNIVPTATQRPIQKSGTKKPLMPKIVITSSNNDININIQNTEKGKRARAPLMKKQKFVVKPFDSPKNMVAGSKVAGIGRDEFSYKIKKPTLKKIDISSTTMATSTTTTTTEAAIDTEDEYFTTETELVAVEDVYESTKNHKERRSLFDDEVKLSLDLSDLQGDTNGDNEFIFVNNKLSEKVKRDAKNIIEEENLGTTAGFIFTGKERYLTNDLSFKNINV